MKTVPFNDGGVNAFSPKNALKDAAHGRRPRAGSACDGDHGMFDGHGAKEKEEEGAFYPVSDRVSERDENIVASRPPSGKGDG